MKIGIIGSGIVGQTLGAAFLQEGHEVMLGSRTPEKEEVQQWQSKNAKGQTGTFDATAQFGELLILSVGGGAALSAVELAGIPNFSGKTVIDTTNPIASAPPEDGVLKFFTDINGSLMEKIQQLIPEANVVKAFNSVGGPLMYKPQLSGGTPTMFICGNSTTAKQTVTDILTDFGWETADMGVAAAARAIEPLCILWCIPGFLHNDWSHAFKVLKP
ncbi:NADPH-dependent F420 reductase [Chitinophaga sp.]|uniref:NADPH-dependent F420 reductase n=1 Tax=Chitinophaga sp. TaxID=1869181 RepID=UPI002F926257